MKTPEPAASLAAPLGTRLHAPDPDLDLLPTLANSFISARRQPESVGSTATAAELHDLLESTITVDGIGVARAWRTFTDVVARHTFDLDGPRFLAFIPMAPSQAAIWMDAAVGAASFSAESWLEAAGAVAAENQALAYIAELAGLPEGSGGAFCSGGSIGNLSALAAGRDARPGRTTCAVADTSHASISRAVHLLGMRLLVIDTGASGRFDAAALEHALVDHDVAEDLAIVAASAGSTNAGIVDDLRGLSEVALRNGAWLHVDGAYGGAALMVDHRRPLFDGLAEADSFIVDPHKWLFSTSGSCALLFREPALAQRALRQSGPYIDVLQQSDAEVEWNPSDYAFQLTRRAGGLPFWFTLAVHGTKAVSEAIESSLQTTTYAAAQLEAIPDVTLVNEPDLGVLLFRKGGWRAAEWRQWAQQLIAQQIAFVAPTTWKGEHVGRLVFMNPLTTPAIVDEVVATLRG